MTKSLKALGAVFIGAGINHFVMPKVYESIMPDYLPAHRELVYASGVAEAAGGALVLYGPTRKAGGWLLIATLIGVFPANLWMFQHPERFQHIPKPLLLARLPGQLAFIVWVWSASLKDKQTATDAAA